MISYERRARDAEHEAEKTSDAHRAHNSARAAEVTQAAASSRRAANPSVPRLLTSLRDARRSAGSDAMAPSLMAKRRARLLVYAMISAFGLLGYGARERMSRASFVSRAWSRCARFDPTTRAPRASVADASPPLPRISVSPRPWQRSCSPCTTRARPARTSSRTATTRISSRARRSRARSRTSATPSRATASSRVSRNTTARLTARDSTRATIPERPPRTIPRTPSTPTPTFLVAEASSIAATPMPIRSRIPSRRSRNRPRTSATPPPTRSSGDRTPRGFPRAAITSSRTRAGAARRARPRGRTSATRGSGIRPRTSAFGKSSRRRTSP